MPKTLCKSLRKDGQPCQGLGQPDLDGYCIAHADPVKVWEWRSRGGKASSAAARADKRIPDRLRGAIDKVGQGMDDLLEGKIEPAALSAIARSARVLVDLYRLADEEMDLIRGEEAAAAAAQVVGGRGMPDLLDKAGEIAAWQNRYRIDSLIAQGLATPERNDKPNTDEAPVPVLTTAGRQRFRYQRLTKYTQEEIDTWRDLTSRDDSDSAVLHAALYHLHFMRTALEDALTDFAPNADPVLDPLTGHPLSRLPDGVKPATVPVAGPDQSGNAARELRRLLRHANKLNRELERIYEEQVGHAFDIRSELPDEDE